MKKNYLKHFDNKMLLIGAFRYFLGRMTISVHTFCRELSNAWVDLPEDIQDQIKKELDQEFVCDDRARAMNTKYKPLGMDMDRRSWEMVRNAYANENKSSGDRPN